MDLPGINDVIKAEERIYKNISKTPIVSSSLLNSWLGHKIFFKAECLQKIGAFKVRGAFNTVAWLIENNRKPQHIVANSSGNHAQAVAWAASQYNIPSTIYMPSFSSEIKIQATLAYGGRVELCDTRVETDENVKQAAAEKGAFWIPPFNHEQVICGQGTAAWEALKDMGSVEAVFAPCGGGGLLSGTLISAHALCPGAKVIGAEPLNANDAAQSLRTGSICKLTGAPDTLADGAMTVSVGDITFEFLRKLDDMYEIEEVRIQYWTQWLTHLLKLQIEPTSALAMEAAFKWLDKQTDQKTILIILSGGNIDQEMNSKIWNKNFLTDIPSLSNHS